MGSWDGSLYAYAVVGALVDVGELDRRATAPFVLPPGRPRIALVSGLGEGDDYTKLPVLMYSLM